MPAESSDDAMSKGRRPSRAMVVIVVQDGDEVADVLVVREGHVRGHRGDETDDFGVGTARPLPLSTALALVARRNFYR